MSEKLDNTVDEGFKMTATAEQLNTHRLLKKYEQVRQDEQRRMLLLKRYAAPKRWAKTKIAQDLRKQINSHLADMNEHELTQLLEFLST